MTQPDEIDLSQCSICGRDATFTDADPGANPVSYCTSDVPAHLRARAEAGQLPLQTDDTLEELKAAAKKLDIEGRSSMNKTQLQAAVAAAKLSEANAADVDARRRDPFNPGVRPAPTPPTPPAPPVPPRRGADEVDSTELEGGGMTDAPVEVPEVHDHSLSPAADDDDDRPKKGPRGVKKR